jgi:hypothetical protein
MGRRILRNNVYFSIYTFSKAPYSPVPLTVLVAIKPAEKWFILPITFVIHISYDVNITPRYAADDPVIARRS